MSAVTPPVSRDLGTIVMEASRMTHLTTADREALRGLGQGQVPAVVERIVAEHRARVAAETRQSVLDEVEQAIDQLANLAAEHRNCSGCPTPWWLTDWLHVEAVRRLRGAERPEGGESDE